MQKTIMIVEDNKTLSDMYRFKLELEWYKVIAKHDGLAAISSLGSLKPDLILLDIMMPGMNGFEVLDVLRGQPSLIHSKILVFSNLNDPKDRQKCIDLGADDFVLKASVTPKELVQRVKILLG